MKKRDYSSKYKYLPELSRVKKKKKKRIACRYCAFLASIQRLIDFSVF